MNAGSYAHSDSVKDYGFIVLEDISVEKSTGLVRDKDNDFIFKLGRREVALLKEFYENQDDVLTKNHLICKVWGVKPVTDGALVCAVHKLRGLLSRYVGRDYIYSVSGVGYIFTKK